jgi:hypothetical protein
MFAPAEQGKTKLHLALPERTLSLLQGGSNTGRELPNPNSEFRIPKEIRKPKPESEKLVAHIFVIRISGFGLLSDFGFLRGPLPSAPVVSKI